MDGWMDGIIDRQMDSSTFQPSFGPSVDSLCHPGFTTTNLSYRFPIFETSATALCGTTGAVFVKHATLKLVLPLFGDFNCWMDYGLRFNIAHVID